MVIKSLFCCLNYFWQLVNYSPIQMLSYLSFTFQQGWLYICYSTLAKCGLRPTWNIHKTWRGSTPPAGRTNLYLFVFIHIYIYIALNLPQTLSASAILFLFALPVSVSGSLGLYLHVPFEALSQLCQLEIPFDDGTTEPYSFRDMGSLKCQGMALPCLQGWLSRYT